MSTNERKWDLWIVAAFFLGRVIFQFCYRWIHDFQVLSVDEYIRLSVSHDLAGKWQWFPDPLWLPGYFWLHGALMKIGLSVRMAGFGVAWVSAGLVSGSLYWMIRNLGTSRQRAIWMTFLFSIQPLSIWLGGVPLSEGPTLAFVLLGLVFWMEGRKNESVLFWIVASLFRYEVWPIVFGLILEAFLEKTEKKSIICFRSILMVLGIAFCIFHIVNFSTPFGAISYTFEQSALSANHLAQRSQFWLAMPRFMAFSMLLLPFIPLSFIKRHTIQKCFFYATASIFLTHVMIVGVGFYPLVYSPRMWLLPLGVGFPLAVLGMSHFLARYPIWKPAILGLLFLFGVAGLMQSPNTEVKRETIKAAEVIKKVSQEYPSSSKTLAERADLGSYVLWGLTGKKANLIFDRVGMREEKLFSDPLWLQRRLRPNSFVSCLLSSSEKGKFVVEKVAPNWEPRWREGKYFLACDPKKKLGI